MGILIGEVITDKEIDFIYDTIAHTDGDMSCFYGALPSANSFKEMVNKDNVRLFYVGVDGEIVLYFGLEYRTPVTADLHMGVLKRVDDVIAISRRCMNFCFELGVETLMAFIASENSTATKLAVHFGFDFTCEIDGFYEDGSSVSILIKNKES